MTIALFIAGFCVFIIGDAFYRRNEYITSLFMFLLGTFLLILWVLVSNGPT